MTTTTSKTGNVESSSSPSGKRSEKTSEPTGLLNAEDWARKPRESKQAKAIRLLTTGRLRVYRVDRFTIRAECRGDSGEIYTLGWWDQRWQCSCPARVDCSHLVALQCVTAVTR